MALIISSTDLKQGTSTPENVSWGTVTGQTVTLTGASFPILASLEFFEIRNHPIAGNNGLYQATGTPTSGSISTIKLGDLPPSTASVEAVAWLGDSNVDAKNVMFDVAAQKMYLLKQGLLSNDGVGLDVFYKFAKEQWKADDFLNSFPFPLFAIDTDAGKYITGTDGSYNNDWVFEDVASLGINTRKLIRSAGWEEQNDAGIRLQVWSGITTLGTFEAPTTDNAYYQFGTNTLVDDTVNFDFNGPVNEAVQSYKELAQVDLVYTTTTITRATGDNLVDGFKVGGEVTIRNSELAGNDGSFTLTAVSASVLTINAGFTTDASDITGILSVDNRKAFRLAIRVRDGNTNGKTFDASDLGAVDELTLGNRKFAFPLSNVPDLKISVTDINIIGNTPYVQAADHSNTNGVTTAGSATFTSAGGAFIAGDVGKLLCIDTGTNAGMYEIATFTSATSVTVNRNFIDTEASITYSVNPYGMKIEYFATSATNTTDYTNGNATFGTNIEANGGTAIQVYEYVQYQLRQNSDIDFDASTHVGRTLPTLLVFEGDTLVSGKSNPTNPDAGGAGVSITNINAADANNITNFDASQIGRIFPETIAITLDFNDALTSDAVSTYDLYFDRTIRTVVSDLVINSGGTITSATSQLAAPLDAGTGAFIRIDGLTGVDAAMNGIYQVTGTPTTSSYAVTRWDGKTLVTTSAAAGNVDQHAVNTPDAIIVDDAAGLDVAGAATSDVAFSFAYSANVQGGRTAVTTYVLARAQGISGAQYIQSSVSPIVSGTPLTITLTASNELNVPA